MHAHNGSVTAWIPSDFEGPVTFSTKNGTLKFSDPVQRRVAHYSRSEKTGKAFIGDWSTGYADIGDDVEAWSGDELILSSENGSIKIEYAEESPETGASDAGSGEGALKYFIRRFMGGPAPNPGPREPASTTMSSISMSATGSRPPVTADWKSEA